MTGFGTCFGLELRALCARRLTQVGIGVAFVTTLVAALMAGAPEADRIVAVVNGWRCLALGMGPGMTVAALVAALLGSQAISSSASDGSLRATLCRPIGRGTVLLGHAAALAAVAALLGLAVVAAGFLGGLPSGFGDVLMEVAGGLYPGPGGQAGLMARRAALLCLGAPITIAAAAWCGLTISVLTDHSGVAAGSALLGGVLAGFLIRLESLTLPSRALDWVFLRPGLRVFIAFKHVAEGDATLDWERAPLGAALLVPMLTMALAGSFALWWFNRRDVLS